MHTILICDDEKDICSALEIYLRGEGYATRICGCGEDALRILREAGDRQEDASCAGTLGHRR